MACWVGWAALIDQNDPIPMKISQIEAEAKVPVRWYRVFSTSGVRPPSIVRPRVKPSELPR